MAVSNVLIPKPATITEIVDQTPDVKLFRVVPDDGEIFDYRPGQCAMLSVLGRGESMISITSSPVQKDCLEFAVKRVGTVTEALHDAEEGFKIGLRGPYGNNFPVDFMKGKNLVFIGGGIGLAPLRSLINYVLAPANRSDYGQVDIIYGARSPADLCFKDELKEVWPKAEETRVHVTVDVGDDKWQGPVGFVPPFLEEVGPSPDNAVAITCGPPIMIKFVLQSLDKLGFTDEQIITTLEMKMQCGVGKCGRCNLGDKYVCVDGPVFSLAQLKELPQEF